MSKWKVLYGDKEEIVEAWRFDVDHGTAVFYDDSGEPKAAFLSYIAIVQQTEDADRE